MADFLRFSYSETRGSSGETLFRPILPVILTHRGTPYTAHAIIDSGADVNVLPYPIGIGLGGNWEQARTGLTLSGNLANYEARGILVNCTVGDLPSVQLAFAWTRAEHVPLLFGQVNFFMEFDVCFFRARSMFEIRSRS